jgi:hypothetical protein
MDPRDEIYKIEVMIINSKTMLQFNTQYSSDYAAANDTSGSFDNLFDIQKRH